VGEEGEGGDHMHLSVASHGVLLLDSAPKTNFRAPFFLDRLETTPPICASPSMDVDTYR